VMAVPAHDERDFEFAKKYKLDILSTITPKELAEEITKQIQENRSDKDIDESFQKMMILESDYSTQLPFILD